MKCRVGDIVHDNVASLHVRLGNWIYHGDHFVSLCCAPGINIVLCAEDQICGYQRQGVG